MPKKPVEPQTTEDKLDIIIAHLHHLDRRDRLRTWGGFFRGVLGLIPMIAFIWGLWYFYNNADEILKTIAAEAAKQAAEATQNSADSFMEQFQNQFRSR